MYDQNKSTILYYPTIKIENERWIRNALLYWDKIASIVPSSNYDDGFTDEILYLQHEGLYEPISPAELTGKIELCKEFCEQVEKKVKQRKSMFNIQKKDRMKIHESKINMLHISKMPNEILDYLMDVGIASKNCDGPWIDMNRRESCIYMSILAKYLAKIHGNTQIGTDSASLFLDPFVSKNNIEEDKQLYLDVAIQYILPEPSWQVSFADIIDFKRKNIHASNNFKKVIDEYQWRLKQCKTIDDILEGTDIFKKNLNDQLQEFEELINHRRSIKRCFRTLVPIAAETVMLLKQASPIISLMANTTIQFGIKKFCKEKEIQIGKDNAYLLCAWREGMIQ